MAFNPLRAPAILCQPGATETETLILGRRLFPGKQGPGKCLPSLSSQPGFSLHSLLVRMMELHTLQSSIPHRLHPMQTPVPGSNLSHLCYIYIDIYIYFSIKYATWGEIQLLSLLRGCWEAVREQKQDTSLGAILSPEGSRWAAPQCAAFRWQGGVRSGSATRENKGRSASDSGIGSPRVRAGNGSTSVPLPASLQGSLFRTSGVELLPSLKRNDKMEGKPLLWQCLKADRAILEHAAQCKGR